MYAVGNVAQLRHNLRPEPQLGGKLQRRATHSGIGQGGHANASAGDRDMIVAQHVGGLVVFAHALESRRANSAVAQFDRSDFSRCE